MSIINNHSVSSAKRNLLFYLFKVGYENIIRFLTNLIIVRALLVTEYGAFNLLSTIAAYLFVLTSLGFPPLLNRYIPQFRGKKLYADIKRLVRFGLLLNLAFSTVVVLLLILFYDSFANLFRYRAGFQVFAIFSIGIIAQGMAELLSRSLEGLFRQDRVAKVRVFHESFRLCSVAILFACTSGFLSYVILETALWIFHALLLLYVYRISLPQSETSPKAGELSEAKPKLVRFASFAYLNEFGYLAFNAPMDLLIISHFWGEGPVGIYALSLKVVHIATLWIKPVNSIFETLLYGVFSRTGDIKMVSTGVNVSVKVFVLALAPLLVITYLFCGVFVTGIYGEKYMAGEPVIQATALFAVLWCVRIPLQALYKCLEKVHVLFWANIFAIYNLIMDLILVPRYGLLGAVLATGSTQVLVNAFLMYYAIKHFKITIDYGPILKFLTATLLLGLLLHSIRPYVPLPLAAGTAFLLALVSPLILLYRRTVLFNEPESRMLLKVLPFAERK